MKEFRFRSTARITAWLHMIFVVVAGILTLTYISMSLYANSQVKSYQTRASDDDARKPDDGSALSHILKSLPRLRYNSSSSYHRMARNHIDGNDDDDIPIEYRLKNRFIRSPKGGGKGKGGGRGGGGRRKIPKSGRTGSSDSSDLESDSADQRRLIWYLSMMLILTVISVCCEIWGAKLLLSATDTSTDAQICYRKCKKYVTITAIMALLQIIGGVFWMEDKIFLSSAIVGVVLRQIFIFIGYRFMLEAKQYSAIN